MEPVSTPPAHPDSTHDVRNQAPPLQPYNVYEADTALQEALEREGGGWGADRFADTGALAGSREALEHSERCERNEPVLKTHDRYGNRVDEIQLDPSWHWLLREGIERGIHSLPWADPRPGAHTVRAGLMFLWDQVNAGVMCPISMTHSVIPALREAPDLAERVGAAAGLHRVRPRQGRHRGHGHDREAGRLGRARQHHQRRPGRATAPTRSPATSGSAPTPRATCS